MHTPTPCAHALARALVSLDALIHLYGYLSVSLFLSRARNGYHASSVSPEVEVYNTDAREKPVVVQALLGFWVRGDGICGRVFGSLSFYEDWLM